MMFPTDLSIRPDELAREAEGRGFESIFYPEHTHIPTSRKTEWPGGGDLPEEYRRLHDPFIALMAAAGCDRTIKLGTGICLVGSTIRSCLPSRGLNRVLSNGRFIFGVGFGWNTDEMESHGVDPRFRRSVVREKILAMKSLWTEDAGSFKGRFVQVEPSWSWPKPAQKPHPPIVIGGAGSETVFSTWRSGPTGGCPSVCVSMWPSASGPCERLHKTQAATPTRSKSRYSARRRSKETLEHYAESGVSRVVFGLPPAPRDVVLPALDRRAAVLSRVR